MTTTWKVSKYGVFSGQYLPACGLNTKRYFLSLRIQSECGKIRTSKNSIFGHISRSGLLTNTGNVWLLFSCRCFSSGGSVSCSKSWWCFLHLSILHLCLDLTFLTKCTFDKQFQESLLVETNYFLSCKFFLMNFSHSISLCGWLHYQQTICLSVDFLPIVPTLVLALYGGTFCFSSCLAMMFAMGLKYSFKRLSSDLSNSINLTSPDTNETSLVALQNGLRSISGSRYTAFVKLSVEYITDW